MQEKVHACKKHRQEHSLSNCRMSPNPFWQMSISARVNSVLLDWVTMMLDKGGTRTTYEGLSKNS